VNTAKIGKNKVTNALVQLFRDGKLEWMTASQLQRRVGGSRDHIKRVADKLVAGGVAIARQGKAGREYHGYDQSTAASRR
jgi:biotin operon repressor